MATKRKVATKTKKPSNQVTTNFKQNHKRKAPGSKGGAVRGGRPGRTQAEFDPEQNVRQDSPEAAEFASEAPSAEIMPAAPAPDIGGDQFINAGRSIPRMPDETV